MTPSTTVLARAGIVQPSYGKNGGYRLAKPAEAISVLAIVTAIDGNATAFRCTEIRRNGPCGGRPDDCYSGPCAFAAVMWEAERAWRDQLAGISLAAVIRRMLRQIDPDERRCGQVWLEANARP
jgi:Rrf2 family protein